VQPAITILLFILIYNKKDFIPFKNKIYKKYMDAYMNKYDSFEKIMVYNFTLGAGGIGDCIKFFMFALNICMKTNTRLYYKKNNIEIEKYIKLIYEKMYITDIINLSVKNVEPSMYYSTINYDYIIIKDVFYFTDEVKINSKYLFPIETKYISIHLRLGDKYLETDKNYVLVKEDTRKFSNEKIYKFIEDNRNNNIFFCCDNNEYKIKIKEMYNNITITNCNIGHSSLSNTSPQQVLDSISEFYILANSEMIYSASCSGFSKVASQFNNIQIIYGF